MSVNTKKLISRMTDFGEVFERQHSYYGSPFIKDAIAKGGFYLSPQTGISYRIPTHFGFCYGVEKSIDLAFETCRRFSDRRIFLTHDVIHNPQVNHDLKEKGVQVLQRDDKNRLVLDGIQKEDIVVISAFGSQFTDVEALRLKGCVVVDTTCGAIVLVWKRVEKYAKNGHTAVIHGIWDHEETQATANQAVKFKGQYLIIRNMAEAQKLEAFIQEKISKEDFLQVFKDCISEGFDPDLHLPRIGIASQTTMLKSETLQIQEYLKGVYQNRFGQEGLNGHFMMYDTICSATQERQDALLEMLEESPDLILIIGGFNSSNTTHLSEMALNRYPTYHIQGPEDLLSKEQIQHLCPRTMKERKTSDWLKSNVKKIGISSGASTPDLLIEKVVQRVESLMA